MKPIQSAILASLISTALSAPTKKQCYSIDPVSLTFYGFPDNDPPSADTAWDCGRGYKAGGNGTYTNPLTTATAPGEFNACETLYLAYLRKYLRVEDTCASCISDWAQEPKEHHIDVWMESGRGDDPGKVLGCEEGLTPPRGVSVVREPGEGFAVDDSPLWDAGRCLTENIYGQDVMADACLHGETNVQESSATRTLKPTRTPTSTSTTTPTADTAQGTGFGMQAGLGWVYAVVLGFAFVCNSAGLL